MPRASRLVVPGLPHHVTQRGVRSANIFSDDTDRELYLSLMRQHAEPRGVRFLAWYLMPNHVHLVVVPEREDSLARGIGDAHRRYTRARNFREGVRGYLFQGRFGSSVLDEKHLLAAVRYVELNPVRAKLVRIPARYEWSSAAYHLGRERADPLVADRTLLGLVDDWAMFLQDGMDEIEASEHERALLTGRPLGSAGFVAGLEKRFGRKLTAGRPGRPRKKRRRED
jgi:putative transposase